MTRLQASTRTTGFTLIELVITMVVVAILAAIAIPSYQTQIRKSRRTDAKTAVLDLAAREEKYFSLNNAYTNLPAYLGYAAAGSGTAFPLNVGSNYYQVYVCVATTTGSTAASAACNAGGATATGSTYVVAAIPPATSTQIKDTSCQYFAVDNTGTQFASSTQGTGANTTTTCWQ